MEEGRIREKVAEIAALLQIDHKLDSKATQLSGGEMQRVAIGRALVRDPAAYLMDEPLSSLDAKLRSELRLELKRIHRELGATIVYVTHDQIEADDDGGSHRGPARRAARAGRRATRDLRVAARCLRGLPARLPGDEPAPGRPVAGRGQARGRGDGGGADRASAHRARRRRQRIGDGAAHRAPGRIRTTSTSRWATTPSSRSRTSRRSCAPATPSTSGSRTRCSSTATGSGLRRTRGETRVMRKASVSKERFGPGDEEVR